MSYCIVGVLDWSNLGEIQMFSGWQILILAIRWTLVMHVHSG